MVLATIKFQKHVTYTCIVETLLYAGAIFCFVHPVTSSTPPLFSMLLCYPQCRTCPKHWVTTLNGNWWRGGGGGVVREMGGCIKGQGLIDYATVVSTLGSSHMIFLFYDLKNKIDVIYSDVTRN